MSDPGIVPWQKADPSRRELPVALISLHDQVSRRDACAHRGLSEAWVSSYWPAKDLRLASRADILNVANLEKLETSIGREALASEVGCAASHRAVAEWLSGSAHPMALVFEDDIVPLFEDFEARTLTVSNALLAKARLGDAFICHLGVREDQIN